MNLVNVLGAVDEWEVKGSHLCRNGSKLVCHLPKVAPKAYLHDRFAPLTDQGINIVEEEINNSLPQQLKEFYRVANGINLFSCTIALYGLRQNFYRDPVSSSCQPFSVVTANTLERLKAPRDIIFFGSYNWDGSLVFCSNDGSQKIYRTEREVFKPVNEWDTFDEFVSAEYDRIRSFFDLGGYEIDEDAPTAPV